jgi:Clostripain family
MPTPAWNLLLYAVAGGLEEEKELASLVEAMRTELKTDACNALVQITTSAATTRHWISRSNPSTERYTPPVNASTEAALRDFLEAGAERPASSTALILCGHGSGLDATRGYPRRVVPHGPVINPGPHGPVSIAPVAPLGPLGPLSPWTRRSSPPDWRKLRRMRGEPFRWGPAPGTSSYLSNPSLRNAIATSTAKRVDLLALNACWMSVLEVEHELSAVSSVQLASQVYATRWPFGAIIKALSAQPAQSTEDLARTIVTRIQADLDAKKREDTVSAFRSSGLIKVAAAVDAYAAALLPLVDSDWDHIVDVVTGPRAQCPHYADLGTMAAMLGKNDATAKKAGDEVRAQLAAARISQAAFLDHKWMQGLSIFWPDKKNMDLAAAYDGLGFQSNRWMQFLKKVQDKLPPDPPS